MSSVALEELKGEILRHRDALAPQLEGFLDLASVNVQSDTHFQVEDDIENAERRERLSLAAIVALIDLDADGYPDLPSIKVSEKIYEDLADQKRTIDAALLRYEPLPPEAVGGDVTIEDEALIEDGGLAMK